MLVVRGKSGNHIEPNGLEESNKSREKLCISAGQNDLMAINTFFEAISSQICPKDGKSGLSVRN